MLRQIVCGKGRSSPACLSTLFRQLHIISSDSFGNGNYKGASQFPLTVFKNRQDIDGFPSFINGINQSPKLTQARQRILEIPMNSVIRPSIGIPPDMLRRSEQKTPLSPKITPLEIPTINGNVNKEIRDDPSNFQIEKQAARLIVIRRAKMNKHKLRKLRKKMKYIWAKIRLRRAIRKEKEYLNSKMDLINAAKNFDAKEYVAGVIKKAKEEPIPYKWTDPLMPEWYKEQEMKKEAWQKRYQKMINLYLNKSITIDFTNKKKLGES